QRMDVRDHRLHVLADEGIAHRTDRIVVAPRTGLGPPELPRRGPFAGQIRPSRDEIWAFAARREQIADGDAERGGEGRELGEIERRFSVLDFRQLRRRHLDAVCELSEGHAFSLSLLANTLADAQPRIVDEM